MQENPHDEKEKIGKRIKRALSTVLLFVGIGGILGGMPLVMDPSGAGLGLDLQMLADSPFSTYLIPGIQYLFFIIGFIVLILGAIIRKTIRE
ncbi:MAG: hypothetical protein GY762_05535 [Proteobacteria bacterium]|nr:hypothetical protein [Pseudomonadota bacterium]